MERSRDDKSQAKKNNTTKFSKPTTATRREQEVIYTPASTVSSKQDPYEEESAAARAPWNDWWRTDPGPEQLVAQLGTMKEEMNNLKAMVGRKITEDEETDVEALKIKLANHRSSIESLANTHRSEVADLNLSHTEMLKKMELQHMEELRDARRNGYDRELIQGLHSSYSKQIENLVMDLSEARREIKMLKLKQAVTSLETTPKAAQEAKAEEKEESLDTISSTSERRSSEASMVSSATATSSDSSTTTDPALSETPGRELALQLSFANLLPELSPVEIQVPHPGKSFDALCCQLSCAVTNHIQALHSLASLVLSRGPVQHPDIIANLGHWYHAAQEESIDFEFTAELGEPKMQDKWESGLWQDEDFVLKVKCKVRGDTSMQVPPRQKSPVMEERLVPTDMNVSNVSGFDIAADLARINRELENLELNEQPLAVGNETMEELVALEALHANDEDKENTEPPVVSFNHRQVTVESVKDEYDTSAAYNEVPIINIPKPKQRRSPTPAPAPRIWEDDPSFLEDDVHNTGSSLDDLYPAMVQGTEQIARPDSTSNTPNYILHRSQTEPLIPSTGRSSRNSRSKGWNKLSNGFQDVSIDSPHFAGMGTMNAVLASTLSQFSVDSQHEENDDHRDIDASADADGELEDQDDDASSSSSSDNQNEDDEDDDNATFPPASVTDFTPGNIFTYTTDGSTSEPREARQHRDSPTLAGYAQTSSPGGPHDLGESAHGHDSDIYPGHKSPSLAPLLGSNSSSKGRRLNNLPSRSSRNPMRESVERQYTNPAISVPFPPSTRNDGDFEDSQSHSSAEMGHDYQEHHDMEDIDDDEEDDDHDPQGYFHQGQFQSQFQFEAERMDRGGLGASQSSHSSDGGGDQHMPLQPPYLGGMQRYPNQQRMMQGFHIHPHPHPHPHHPHHHHQHPGQMNPMAANPVNAMAMTQTQPAPGPGNQLLLHPNHQFFMQPNINSNYLARSDSWQQGLPRKYSMESMGPLLGMPRTPVSGCGDAEFGMVPYSGGMGMQTIGGMNGMQNMGQMGMGMGMNSMSQGMSAMNSAMNQGMNGLNQGMNAINQGMQQMGQMTGMSGGSGIGSSMGMPGNLDAPNMMSGMSGLGMGTTRSLGGMNSGLGATMMAGMGPGSPGNLGNPGSPGAGMGMGMGRIPSLNSSFTPQELWMARLDGMERMERMRSGGMNQGMQGMGGGFEQGMRQRGWVGAAQTGPQGSQGWYGP
ncbi:Similar to hypothetical protein [Tuber melanosporum Mel28]; acc. no. XP_002836599 [Pyronema omphalodes CBS 100304]|uniref:Uncharacterized protein n=1 Tax=Pyronema omphalodes (strain CBS 100304) TaxID=1076935 RepID=U4LGJ4_PYROM|nr:Similar to hypothetical protein [Tuber melanosporum Mel28]; acc. no. XP_002836599 [Pyronema omphalodes CBS 100304]